VLTAAIAVKIRNVVMTSVLWKTIGEAKLRTDFPAHILRENSVGPMTAYDQPRRVGGSGSGVSSLPRRTAALGQKATIFAGASDDGMLGASPSMIGTTQPIAAMQSSVMPLQGLRTGDCCCAIIFMQSALMPDIATGADAGDEIDA
jgi:hypothetical protein